MKISIVSRSTRSLDDMRRFVEAYRNASVQVVQGGTEILGPVVDQQQPDVLIYECQGNDPCTFVTLSSLSMQHPTITLVLLTPNPEPALLLEAMRAGVREVLPSPVQREALQAAIGRVSDKLVQSAPSRTKGKVLAFIPCKGGSGSTFLATNLGYVLASELNKKVILFDLCLQFGDAALFLSDNKPMTNIAELTQQISRLDSAFLASSLLSVLPNFGVLAAPEDPVQAMEVRAEHIETLLNLARGQYDYVILDVGRALDPASIKALDLADIVFPVMQATMPFVRDAKRLLDVFRTLGYAHDKIRLIVNRHEKGGDIRMEDIEHTLGIPVFKAIPNNYRVVAASVNQGIPVAKLVKGSPVTKSLQELGNTLTNNGTSESRWWDGFLLRPAVAKV